MTVEGVARRLGVTKGSFYWHFADRAALIANALDLWEQLATREVIIALDQISDPKARLEALFTLAFGDVVDGPIDAALATRLDDPIVGPVVRRVTEERIAFLERIYRELGLTPAKAAGRARIAYSTYLGHFQVRRALPGDRRLANPGTAYLRQLLEVLASGID